MKKKRNARTLPRVRPEDVKIVTGARPRFLKLREACRYGCFGRTKAWELINAGYIKAVRFGNYTMVEVASIDRFHASLPKVSEKEARAS